jgi:uncharacterized protein YjbI with pentapeptide repeats
VDLRNLQLIVGVNLEYTNFSGANLQGAAPYNCARLKRTNFIGANLQGAHLEVDLSGTHLEGADLRDATLQGDLTGAHFQGADLSGAHLGGADLRYATFEGANGADVRYAHLKAKPQGATADKYTQWPDGYPWRRAGVKELRWFR